jgi:hypothetical protein
MFSKSSKVNNNVTQQDDRFKVLIEPYNEVMKNLILLRMEIAALEKKLAENCTDIEKTGITANISKLKSTYLSLQTSLQQPEILLMEQTMQTILQDKKDPPSRHFMNVR